MTAPQEQAGSGAGPNPPRLPSERPGPAGGKRDRNRRERTAALLESALELFLERGIEGVSIDAITRAAGLAKGSFYRYFEGKQQLVEALVAPVRQRLEAAIATCRGAMAPGAEPMAVFAAYAAIAAEVEATVREHPGVARLYLQETRAPVTAAREPLAAVAKMIADSAVELTEVAQRHGLLRSVTPKVSALATIGAAERLLQAWFEGRLEGDESTVAAELVGILMAGLQPD